MYLVQRDRRYAKKPSFRGPDNYYFIIDQGHGNLDVRTIILRNL